MVNCSPLAPAPKPGKPRPPRPFTPSKGIVLFKDPASLRLKRFYWRRPRDRLTGWRHDRSGSQAEIQIDPLTMRRMDSL
jgi:hypothetical protein